LQYGTKGLERENHDGATARRWGMATERHGRAQTFLEICEVGDFYRKDTETWDSNADGNGLGIGYGRGWCGWFFCSGMVIRALQVVVLMCQ